MVIPTNQYLKLQIVVLKKLCFCKTYCKNYMGALETLDRLVYLINVATSMIGKLTDRCLGNGCSERAKVYKLQLLRQPLDDHIGNELCLKTENLTITTFVKMITQKEVPFLN